MTIEVTVVEFDIESWMRRPAVTSRFDVYLIQDRKVIGEMHVSSARGMAGGTGFYECVNVDPADQATRDFFEGDPGWIDGHIYNLKYSGVFGDPYLTSDEEEARYKDTKIVDKFEFDFGICHPSFKDVEGFDNYHKRPKPRNHVPQKRRRPRNSNKIKKVR